ncbi:MAG: hypothetical protein H8E44_10315 [Planctomycetes bacterium]|nr:hypothetical protein [Planctomycetota bacterium]MBL7042034.1 hypothetical protein [Pirellulaceae bacterium]
MAKSKRQQSSTAKESATEPRAVRQALQKLRAFYQDGCSLLESGPDKPEQGTDSKDAIKEMARKRGKPQNRFWQARKFAKNYNEEQFEELCSLRRPDGKPLSPSHFVYLLLVNDKRRRKSLQRRTIKESWSTSRLYDEIRQVQASSTPAGAPFRRLESTDDALVQIANMTGRWLRWVKVLEPGEEGEAEGEITFDDLPESVRKELKSASRSIRKLRDAALRELGQDADD